MYRLFIDSHIAISAIFIITAITSLYRSGYALYKTGAFTRFDKALSIIFILFLFLQFLLGASLYLFFMPKLSDPALSLEEAQQLSEMQFWVIEHLSIMLFSTILGLIGRIFIKQSVTAKLKHKNTLIYYGITFILIITSMILALYKEM